jgi:hypothetical protein
LAFFSPKHIPRDNHAIPFNWSMSLGNSPQAYLKKAQQLIEYLGCMGFGGKIQVPGECGNFWETQLPRRKNEAPAGYNALLAVHDNRKNEPEFVQARREFLHLAAGMAAGLSPELSQCVGSNEDWVEVTGYGITVLP